MIIIPVRTVKGKKNPNAYSSSHVYSIISIPICIRYIQIQFEFQIQAISIIKLTNRNAIGDCANIIKYMTIRITQHQHDINKKI